jgi:hypothetical protein
MTPAPQYYPVTKDELNFIKNDCIHPESDKCLDDCTAWNSKELVCDFGANILMDEVLSRPPVSASSDKVLDKAIDKITAQLNDRDRKWKGMQKSIEILAELRQQTKEREQG